MLDVTNLSYAYNAGSPDEIVALRGVSLHAAPGELVAIIGHNGSGKSTLAKLLAAVIDPPVAAIRVDGIESNAANVWEIRQRVGLVFQRPDDQLITNTVIDDLAFGPENLGVPRAEIEQRISAALTALDLEPLRHAQISELSGGEKQRVAIAGVLTMQPSYLILDEPTTMIAPPAARRLLARAHDLAKRTGLAILHITHFMHEIVGFDRVIVLDEGRVIAEGSPREVFARAEELRAIGLNIPLVTELGRRLQARGVALAGTLLTTTELVEGLRTAEPTTDREADRTTDREADKRIGTAEPATDREADKRIADTTADTAADRTTEPGTDKRSGTAEPATDREADKRSGTAEPATDREADKRSGDTAEGEASGARIGTASGVRKLIETRDLHFSYMADTPLEQVALRGVSCAVYEGETLALLGGSQAGKSTLIEFFNALRRSAPGQVFFEGNDTAAPDADIDHIRRSVGIVFQQPEAQLIEDTVGKDVSFAPRRKGRAPAESRAIVEQALTAVGLDYETYRLRYIHALSGGQKRRVAIAGVLAAEPRVLILDEPLAGLDPRGRSELAMLIADLTRRLGLTIILVGNAVDDLAELATRAIVMHDGQIALEAPLRELLHHADQLHTLGLELGEPAEIALALRQIFPTFRTDLLHLDELEEELMRVMSYDTQSR